MTEPRQPDDLAEIDVEIPEASEERRHPRVRDPGIGGRLPHRIAVRLVDLSVSGVGLESMAPLGAASDYRLILENDRRHIERSASLVWNRLERTANGRLGDVTPVYRSGLRLEPGPPGAASDLKAFIGELGPEARGEDPPDGSEHRATTRYCLNKAFKLFLDTEPECDIKTLSLSGLLLESRLRLAPGTLVRLFLQLPQSEIEARARVVSLERAGGSPASLYRVAMEFIEMSEGGRRDLGAFVDERSNDSQREVQPTAHSGETLDSRLVVKAALGRVPAGWILPTLASLLALGVLLTSVSADSAQSAGALAWGLKALGAAVIGLTGYVGLRWLLQKKTISLRK